VSDSRPDFYLTSGLPEPGWLPLCRWQVVSVVRFQSSPVCVDMFERVF